MRNALLSSLILKQPSGQGRLRCGRAGKKSDGFHRDGVDGSLRSLSLIAGAGE